MILKKKKKKSKKCKKINKLKNYIKKNKKISIRKR